jgi:Ser/Thr protein kinase RdoA (MazF antagonist)
MNAAAHTKRYPDIVGRARAYANYQWLARLGSPLHLPALMPGSVPDTLVFEQIEGRHAQPSDLPMLAGHLGHMHATAYVRDLHRAQLGQPHRTPAGYELPSFPSRRQEAVTRELHTGTVCGARFTASRARLLIAHADGPAAFYKDANPRNFLITPTGNTVMVDFDDLTLAPFGYDLAKLIVTLAMTHGRVPEHYISAALHAYNLATASHCATLAPVRWHELMNWAEIHHILTSRYAADGRYHYSWDAARPRTRPRIDRPWP